MHPTIHHSKGNGLVGKLAAVLAFKQGAQLVDLLPVSGPTPTIVPQLGPASAALPRGPKSVYSFDVSDGKSLRAWVAASLGIPNWGQVFIGILALVALLVWREYSGLREDISNNSQALTKQISSNEEAVHEAFDGVNSQLADLRRSIQVLSQESPNKELVNQWLDERVRPIRDELQNLDKRLDETREVEGELRVELQRQRAISVLPMTERILAMIKSELEAAQEQPQTVPVSRLRDYKLAIRGLPRDSSGFWDAVYIMVNFESLLRQSLGLAPDPAQVAKPCGPVTIGQGNVFIGDATIRECIVNLDTQEFIGITFEDCVVRHSGGPVQLKEVRFVNCRFIIESQPESITPSEQQLLIALVASEQQDVTVTAS